MSKKTNTWLFILGATVFNIVVTIGCFVILLVLFARFVMPYASETVVGYGIPVLFVAAVALSFVLYRVVIKQLVKRVNVEKYFDPIFNSRRRPVKKNQD
jgi:hypothetical protein